MGQDQTFTTRRETFAKGGPQASVQPTLLRRHPLGVAQRRTLEGFARPIPFAEYMLATFTRMGTTRRVVEDLANVSRPTRRTRPTGLGRNICRRQLCPGKKGGVCVGKTKRGKGTKWMVVASGQGIPLGVQLVSASPHEVTLIESTLDRVAVPRKHSGRPRKNPKRLIYDKAADSDSLRKRLKKRGIELICPHKANRTKPPTQDGRSLRRYVRRWKIERSIAWIGNFRRLVVRYERDIRMYQAFFHVACLLIVLRQF